MNELAKALAAAQGEFEPALKGNVNPAFKSKYADLAACIDAVRGPLAKHGLSVTQSFVPPSAERPDCLMRTTLWHESGQWIASDFPIFADWGQPQKVGSAITYARRYTLCALLQIAQEDDDGESAMGRGAGSGASAGYHPNGGNRPASAPPRPNGNAADRIADAARPSRPPAGRPSATSKEPPPWEGPEPDERRPAY